MIPSKRRYFWRAAFNTSARLMLPDGECPTEVLDISLKGALVMIPETRKGFKGKPCQLKIDLADDATIVMDCVAVHADGTRMGLRCDKIDLDSITHLRRLVELNVGDGNILERDLNSLISEHRV